MARKDITDILANWEFDPDVLNVRRIKGTDSSNKIQLRLDLGLLQMNETGRPDGQRPHGFVNMLEYYKAEREHVEEYQEGYFVLTPDDLRDLQQESIQYYHRYLCFAELEDHEGVIRDTAHNLETLEFVEEFADDEESAWAFLQYYPYIKMMNIQARVQMALEEEKYSEALGRIDTSIEAIKAFNKKWGLATSKESTREIKILKDWRETVLEKKPISALEKLRQELEEAIRLEHYEKAARIRDELEEMQENK